MSGVIYPIRGLADVRSTKGLIGFQHTSVRVGGAHSFCGVISIGPI